MKAQITSAAERQTAISEEIVHSIRQMAASIDTVAQGPRREAGTARKLSVLSAGLDSAIKQFKI